MIITFNYTVGHLNPAGTTGVYVERSKLKKYVGFYFGIMAA
jgi:hypothetical protein